MNPIIYIALVISGIITAGLFLSILIQKEEKLEVEAEEEKELREYIKLKKENERLLNESLKKNELI